MSNPTTPAPSTCAGSLIALLDAVDTLPRRGDAAGRTSAAALIIDSGDPALTRTIVHARADLLPSPRAARRYRDLLIGAGFSGVHVEVHASLITGATTLAILTELVAAAHAAGAVLAYQRVPGTLVLIDRPHLDPNPFDAEPADPIALVPARLTRLRPAAARALRRQLPLAGPPAGTVRWQTSGLDREIESRRRLHEQPRGWWRPPCIPPTGFQARIDRVGGLLGLAVWGRASGPQTAGARVAAARRAGPGRGGRLPGRHPGMAHP